MGNQEMLEKTVEKISNLYELGSQSTELLKEVIIHFGALEAILIEKGVFTETELENKIKESKK
ncbi:hypothetical protein [Oceanobacillus kimchii]|uniref:hypothetical protein n=1 Tax=Oceanobacillus kimchii TaxID=746691 RepID=UPI003C757505